MPVTWFSTGPAAKKGAGSGRARRVVFKMNRMVTTLALFLILCVAAGAQEGGTRPDARISQPDRDHLGGSEISRLDADLMGAMTVYRESLERVLNIYEREVQKLTEQVAQWREFYQRGYIARVELEERERVLAVAKANVERTGSRIEETGIAIREAEAQEELMRQPPALAGASGQPTTSVRYEAVGRWSLADANSIVRFFSASFGRLLPITALGQTPLHERMGLDHRDAMDVAVHPDSPEGRALMAYLRGNGIPFIAFWNRVSGAATGAHIHIGRPSLRMTSK
ncbi:MAG: hypothetical protein A2038_08835 [Deltaproteobacteria bacterium GWA2_57_13]|nr:MAG: hypothetical protein A2038_08835 [Deltaproteobacteria bacterium GWA2_57_13]OGQ76243.1 MAG: hypothetical protein A3G40_13805 [Deltaproteobacteria bacterium RIFCSPLOWO2_12_FULL_57_22]